MSPQSKHSLISKFWKKNIYKFIKNFAFNLLFPLTYDMLVTFFENPEFENYSCYVWVLCIFLSFFPTSFPIFYSSFLRSADDSALFTGIQSESPVGVWIQKQYWAKCTPSWSFDL